MGAGKKKDIGRSQGKGYIEVSHTIFFLFLRKFGCNARLRSIKRDSEAFKRLVLDVYKHC